MINKRNRFCSSTASRGPHRPGGRLPWYCGIQGKLVQWLVEACDGVIVTRSVGQVLVGAELHVFAAILEEILIVILCRDIFSMSSMHFLFCWSISLEMSWENFSEAQDNFGHSADGQVLHRAGGGGGGGEGGVTSATGENCFDWRNPWTLAGKTDCMFSSWSDPQFRFVCFVLGVIHSFVLRTKSAATLRCFRCFVAASRPPTTRKSPAAASPRTLTRSLLSLFSTLSLFSRLLARLSTRPFIALSTEKLELIMSRLESSWTTSWYSVAHKSDSSPLSSTLIPSLDFSNAFLAASSPFVGYVVIFSQKHDISLYRLRTSPRQRD